MNILYQLSYLVWCISCEIAIITIKMSNIIILNNLSYEYRASSPKQPQKKERFWIKKGTLRGALRRFWCYRSKFIFLMKSDPMGVLCYVLKFYEPGVTGTPSKWGIAFPRTFWLRRFFQLQKELWPRFFMVESSFTKQIDAYENTNKNLFRFFWFSS